MCAIDIPNERVDIWHDTVGIGFIASGVVPLIQMASTPRYTILLKLVVAVCIFSFLDAVRVTLGVEFPRPFHAVPLFVLVAELAAALAFIRSMRLLTAWHAQTMAERSWRTTEWLYLPVYAVPGVVAVVFAVSTWPAREPLALVHYLAAIPILIPVALAPAIHFWLSVARTIEAARGAPADDSASEPPRESGPSAN